MMTEVHAKSQSRKEGSEVDNHSGTSGSKRFFEIMEPVNNRFRTWLKGPKV
jgi:hypothetical protein